jgi:gliding motility-associated-like protein
LLIAKSISHVLKYFLLCQLILLSTFSFSQTETKGKEFWGTSTDGLGSDSAVLFISSEQAASVSVQVFATSITYNLSVAANSLVSLKLPRTSVMCNGNQAIETKSFKVTASVDVSAYILYPNSATTDATVLYPTQSIPINSNYLLLTYGESFATGREVAVLSHDDNTTVQITLKNDNLGTSLDSVITVTLDKGECFQVKQMSGYQISGGTAEVLTSGKKVSVFCGNRCTNAGSCSACDMLLEQVPPSSTLGLFYLVTPFQNHTNGFILEVASLLDNTILKRDGIVVDTLEKGEVYSYDVNTFRAVCIEGSKPILVSQIMKGKICNGGNNGDPSLCYVSPLQQMITSALIATSNTTLISKHYLSIILPKRGIDSLYLDGVLVPRSKLTASNCGDFYWYTDSVAAGTHSLFNKFGFSSTVYGLGGYESYLYTAGSGLRNLSMEITYEDFPLCDSGRIFVFQASDSTSAYYNWVWDDGSPPDSGQTAVHSFYDLSREYLVKLAYENVSGFIDTSYQYISFSDSGTLNLIVKDKIAACTDSTYSLDILTIPTFNYVWNNGDTTSNITLSTGGIYSVIATDSITGCQAFDTVQVSFYKGVQADFSFPSPLLCGGTNIEMTEAVTFDPTTDSVTHFNWYIDYQYRKDGKRDTLYNAIPNNYDIELRIETINGCRDSITKRVVVSDTPRVETIITVLDKCLNNNLVEFKDISSAAFGKIDTTFWVFSDGDTLGDNYILKHFDTAGNKWVDINVKTEQGCVNTERYFFRIEPSPAHGMQVIDSIPCFLSNRFQFKSLHPNTSPSLYLWYWGDGTSTGTTIPTSTSKKYADTGQYEVKLIAAFNSTGCTDTTIKMVNVINKNPIASLRQDSLNYCLKGNYIHFTDLSTVPNGFTYTRKWLTADTVNNGGDSAIALRFDSAGINNIKLVITTAEGCTDTLSKKFTVFPTNYADFTILDSFNCQAGNYFIVKNLAPLKDARFYWYKSDGTSKGGLADSVSLSFSAPGTYTITLETGTNLYDCRDTFIRTVTVFPNATATLAITDTSSCITNNLFKALDQTDYKGVPAFNSWFINGKGISNDTNTIAAHFDTTGNHSFQLIAGTKSMCPDTTTKIVTVINDFSGTMELNDSAQCLSGNLFNFSINKTSANDSIVAYTWDLAENNTSAQAAPIQTYTNEGTKAITSYIKTKFGCTDTLTRMVTVFPQLNPAIAALDSSQCLRGNSFVFSYLPASDEDSIASVSWQFDDGYTASTFFPNPVSYDGIGSKKITVNTVTKHGCKDSATLQVAILDHPKADFITDTVCLTELSTVASTSTPSGEIVAYAWEVDNTPVNGNETMQTAMSASGQYDVQLIVTNTAGCQDTAYQTASLVVMDAPTADFDFELFPQNVGSLTVNFKDQSSPDVVYRAWSFPGQPPSYLKDPLVTFNQKGKLKIILYTENIAGCFDTAMRTIDFEPAISILVPSAFSPNGDTKNEGFGPAFIERNSNYTMQIFTRWGELVFETDDVSKRWDGTYKGADCPAGVYLYVIGYVNDYRYQAVKGTVNLVK